MHMHWIEYKIT